MLEWALGQGLGALERAGGEDAAEGTRSAETVSLGDAVLVERATGGVEKEFGGAGKDWGSAVCTEGISLEDFACAVVVSADGHTEHEEENEEAGCVWDYVAHGEVVISNGVGVVGEGTEAFEEEKGGELDWEDVEEVSRVLEDGNQVAGAQKVAWVVVVGAGVAIDGVLIKPAI